MKPDFASIFKNYARIPSYVSGSIRNDMGHVYGHYVSSIRSLSRELKRSTVSHFNIIDNKCHSGFPIDLGDLILSKESPSGQLMAAIRTVKNDKKRMFVEVL
jgi:hypothetical protein